MAKMTKKNHENALPLVPANSSNTELSNLHMNYVLSISMPTIRIKIPKLFVKLVQKRNPNDEINGGKSRNNHGSKKSRKGFRKRVGSAFSNVFGKKKKSPAPETDSGSSDGEYGEVRWDEDEDLIIENWKKSVERSSVGVEPAKTERKQSNGNDSNGEVQQMVVATGLGISKSRVLSEIIKDEDEAEERREKQQVAAVSKVRSERTNKADDGAGDDNSGSSIVVRENREAKSVRTTKKVAAKHEKISTAELPKFASGTALNTRRRVKIAWPMKKLMGGTEKNELCKKRILMGGKCRPLGTIRYDENGILLPEIDKFDL